MTKATIIAVAVTALCGCGGGSAPQADGRAAAIQKMLNADNPAANGSDKRPTAIGIINGPACSTSAPHPAGRDNPASYAHIPGVHVVARATSRNPDGTRTTCWTVTWDASTGIYHENVGFSTAWAVPIGTYIVDKVGDEQTGPLGIKVTPYKAHVETNALGKALIAAHITMIPKDITDGQSALHKDADGTWIAQ
jgi:hypothetical protein